MPTLRRRKTSAHEDVVVPFNKLHFDPHNPRNEREDDEEKIRTEFGAQEETTRLAAHMAEYGQNPLDRLAIVKHPKLADHFVVREGNRRLSAMQLLRDPERAPANTRKTFTRLAASGVLIPDQVQAVLFNEQPKARVWMSVKHEGEQGGVGTVRWKPAQQARFNREGLASGTSTSKNPNRQAEALLSYAVAQGLITAEERPLISLTTLTRYLPNVRSALALVNSEDCTTNAPLAEFNAGVQRFLKDAVTTGKRGEQASVHSRSKKEQRNTYAEQLRSEAAPSTRNLQPYDPASAPLHSAAMVARGSKSRSARDPSKRKQLIPGSFAVPVKDNVLLRLVKEGKSADPDESPFSCNYLNRVILERLVHLYAKKHGVGGQGLFDEVVLRVITHAKQRPTPVSKGIENILKKSADKRSVYAYEIMSSAVHGGTIPTGKDNRSNWDTLAPALEYLMGQL
jgi:hypothetical protein